MSNKPLSQLPEARKLNHPEYLGGVKFLRRNQVDALIKWILSDQYQKLKARLLWARMSIDVDDIRVVKEVTGLKHREFSFAMLQEMLDQAGREVGAGVETQGPQTLIALPITVLQGLARGGVKHAALVILVASTLVSESRQWTFDLLQQRLANRLKIKQTLISRGVNKLIDLGLIVKVYQPVRLLKRFGSRYSFTSNPYLKELNLYNPDWKEENPKGSEGSEGWRKSFIKRVMKSRGTPNPSRGTPRPPKTELKLVRVR